MYREMRHVWHYLLLFTMMPMCHADSARYGAGQTVKVEEPDAPSCNVILFGDQVRCSHPRRAMSFAQRT